MKNLVSAVVFVALASCLCLQCRGSAVQESSTELEDSFMVPPLVTHTSTDWTSAAEAEETKAPFLLRTDYRQKIKEDSRAATLEELKASPAAVSETHVQKTEGPVRALKQSLALMLVPFVLMVAFSELIVHPKVKKLRAVAQAEDPAAAGYPDSYFFDKAIREDAFANVSGGVVVLSVLGVLANVVVQLFRTLIFLISRRRNKSRGLVAPLLTAEPTQAQQEADLSLPEQPTEQQPDVEPEADDSSALAEPYEANNE